MKTYHLTLPDDSKVTLERNLVTHEIKCEISVLVGGPKGSNLSLPTTFTSLHNFAQVACVQFHTPLNNFIQQIKGGDAEQFRSDYEMEVAGASQKTI